MPAELPILYVKTGCPWCGEVIEFLSTHGIGYREQNVSQNFCLGFATNGAREPGTNPGPRARGNGATALDEMERISGQTKAPVLDWHGKILADFGVEELKPFLQSQDVGFEDS